MGHAPLEAALGREIEAKIRTLWDEVDAEVAQLRRQRQQARDERSSRCCTQEARERERCIATARRQAQQSLGEDEATLRQELAQRLWQRALVLLAPLAQQQGEELLAALVAELPDSTWQEVRVHPRDVVVAQRLFPAAQVLKEETICGGLLLEDDRGRRIDNRLEKRLERLWPTLLTEMIRHFCPHGEDADASVD